MMISTSKLLSRTYSIAVIGPPASGKGTISKWLARDFDAQHISTGDLLRQSHLDNRINTGKLSSDSIVLNLLNDHLKSSFKHDAHNFKFCLDGFPRRKSQAEALDSLLNESFKVQSIEAVILLDLPISILTQRIRDRWIHPSSGRTYSYSFSPPKIHGIDDLTGEPLLQRSDDQYESFKTRLHHYQAHLDEIKNYYANRGILFSFTGDNSVEIYEKILSTMGGKFNFIEKIQVLQ